MRLRYARVSIAGPVRTTNEDALDFWEPEDPLVRERQGSLALLADGVGGYAHGEIASQLAIDEALRIFKKADPAARPYEVLRQMFAQACRRVFEAARTDYGGQLMATTLLATLFRDRMIYLAHVGDTRSYFIRQKEIRRLTQDHVVTALPVKLGLMLERQAMASPQRSHLTRSVGAEAICQPDFATHFLHHGDFILNCTDGLHAYVLDEEMREIVARQHPYDACRELVALVEKRGGDDNISLQLIEIRDWEEVSRQAAARSATLPAGQKAAGAGDLTAGTVLDERFELTDLVARSNMASIFKATDRQSGESVAVKVPLATLESDAASSARFAREEEIGARLLHPAVLKVIKVEGAKSRPYLVMEFLDGETLAQALARERPLPEAMAVRYASALCDALSYLHANGIVHRDLKPQNIMICRDGTLRLFDFGIARVEKARRMTFVGLTPTMGTPDYISPEQVRGKRGDSRSDLYSLGAILYEMATGSTPFEGESPYIVMNARVSGDPVAPRLVNPKLTPVLEEIILHALERDVRQRYATAAEMKQELDDYERVPMGHRAQRLRSPQPWRTGKWRFWGCLIAIEILIILAAVVYFRHWH